MTPEEEHRRALEYECEELTAEAYKRGRSEALEEAAVKVLHLPYDAPLEEIAATIRALKT